MKEIPGSLQDLPHLSSQHKRLNGHSASLLHILPVMLHVLLATALWGQTPSVKKEIFWYLCVLIIFLVNM